jgi:hypothetical protein
MRLPESAHTSQQWRIHELRPGYRVEDVWQLPASGGADDFPRLVELVSSFDPAESSRAVRALFALRWKIGALLRWDPPRDADKVPFKPVYSDDREWAADIRNKTMHGVLHLGWIPDGTGRYRGQMAVLVKPSGLLGQAYMAAIRPFRYAIVYPAMLRELERKWSS